MQQSYYDIDAILAEEELLPCTTLFEFAHLAGLDPGGSHNHKGRYRNECDNGASSVYLPENSRIKISLWAVEKWAMLGFIRLQLPRHYGRRARERYDADPGDVNLRKRNERFFLSGRRLVQLIEQSSTQVAKAIASLPRSRKPNNDSMIRHAQALRQVSEEALALRRTLLQIYAGERLRRVFDWSQSGAGGTGSGDSDDDVSGYLNQLSEMEQRLYYVGSSAAADLEEWKIFGNRHLWMGSTSTLNSEEIFQGVAKSYFDTCNGTYKRTVTPGDETKQLEPAEQRQRLQ